MEATGPFPLEGRDVVDLPSQEQQAEKKEKALRHLRAYIELCGGTLTDSWDCALRFRTTTRRKGRLGLTTDNYYYSPCGKTFRTHRQVADFLRLPEPQQRQQPYVVIKTCQQQQAVSSALPARVPTDPRRRMGLKRPMQDAAAVSNAQVAKRPAVSVASSCMTTEGQARTETAPDAQPAGVAAAAAVAATSISGPSCCSEQQWAGSLEQSAQSMPPPPVQPVRRTKGLLATKYAGIGSGTNNVRSSIAINTTGSFYDLCFSLAAAGDAPLQAPVQQPRQRPVLQAAVKTMAPADTSKQAEVLTGAATSAAVLSPQPAVLEQQQQPKACASAAAVAVPVGKRQQQQCTATPASSSTSSGGCTGDSYTQAAAVDSAVLLAKQPLMGQQSRKMPAVVAASTPSASAGTSSLCDTLVNAASLRSSLVRCGLASSNKNGEVQSSLAVTCVIAKQRTSKDAAKHKETAKQQQQGPSKPCRPRAQPAWRAQLRQLASKIAAEKVATDSTASGATVQ